MSEKLYVKCEKHNLDSEITLASNKIDKRNMISFDAIGQCGCNFGTVESELILK